MDCQAMNDALNELRTKYAVAQSGTIVADANGVAGAKLQCAAGVVPLLPWRVERRFEELKKLVDGGTLEAVSTLRFAAMRADAALENMLLREFDLVEFMVGVRIKSAFAALAGEQVANVIATLADGKSASIECSVALPAGSAPIDRHEIIAARGVACDRVVDTQVPQASIYAFTEAGHAVYTDTDAELFGMSEAEILVVRAALALLKNPALGDKWSKIELRLREMVAATLKLGALRQVAHFAEEVQ